MCPLTLTEYGIEQLALAATGGGAPFVPPQGGLQIWYDASANVYTNAPPTVPCVNQGDEAFQAFWPTDIPLTPTHAKVVEDTDPVVPVYYPGASGPPSIWHDGAGEFSYPTTLQDINLQDCTALWWGLPFLDISVMSGFLLMLGNFNTGDGIGIELAGQDSGSPFTGLLHLLYPPDGAHAGPPNLDITGTCITMQSSPSGIVVNVNGMDSTALPAYASAVHVNVVYSGWDTSTGTVQEVFKGGWLIWSPRLSDADLAAVQAHYLAQAQQLNPWPNAWPLLAWLGDSLTAGAYFGSISSIKADAMPWQVMNALTHPIGHVTPAMTGGTTADQLATYAAPGINSFKTLFSASRGGTQLTNVLIGVNDLSDGAPAGDVYASIISICENCRVRGSKVNVCTQWSWPGIDSGVEAQRAALRTMLLADFTVATTATRVTSARSSVTYADYCTDLSSNPELDPVAHPENYVSGPHLTAAGCGFAATDLLGMLALPAINIT